MKKFILFTFLLLTGIVFTYAQTQRMVMYEGFSNASCGPCASQNPVIQAVVDANLTRVVALKYQTNWPGVDPMNAQTQAEVGPRVTYYNITGVPATRVDGLNMSLTQANVNTRMAVPSPFFLNLSHSLNTTGDSMHVTAVVKAAQAYTGTNLVLQVAMVEREINFATAPGSNGERDFHNIMRRMIPNSSGTALPSTWNLNDSVVLNFTVRIPTFIYDVSTVAFVAFVQQNSDRAVLQAAKTEPLPIDNYAVITSHNIPNEPTCIDSIALQIQVQNKGNVNVTSMNIEYGQTGQTPNILNWTGSIAANQTLTINLPSITLVGNSPTVFARVYNTNNVTGTPTTNTRVERTIQIISGYTQAPINQLFTASTFPPANWYRVSTDNVLWNRSTAGGFGLTPGGSARMDFFNSPLGQIDFLYIEGLNFTGMSNMELSFSLAHATYSSSYNDRLIIEVSTNCGVNWTSVYNKASASGLTTAPFTTSAFTPTAAQWRKETVNLSQFDGQSEVLVRFRAVSGFGNNLFVDDVVVAQTTSISENNSVNYVNIFPNPIDEDLNIEISLKKQTTLDVKIYDIQGRLVASNNTGKVYSGQNNIIFDASKWNSGVYFVVVTTQEGVINKRVVKK